jgi:hypothetical protein
LAALFPDTCSKDKTNTTMHVRIASSVFGNNSASGSGGTQYISGCAAVSIMSTTVQYYSSGSSSSCLYERLKHLSISDTSIEASLRNQSNTAGPLLSSGTPLVLSSVRAFETSRLSTTCLDSNAHHEILSISSQRALVSDASACWADDLQCVYDTLRLTVLSARQSCQVCPENTFAQESGAISLSANSLSSSCHETAPGACQTSVCASCPDNMECPGLNHKCCQSTSSGDARMLKTAARPMRRFDARMGSAWLTMSVGLTGIATTRTIHSVASVLTGMQHWPGRARARAATMEGTGYCGLL